MTRYLEILFRSKLRLVLLVVLLPLALSVLDLTLWRSYDVAEVIWVDDPNTFGPQAAPSLGYNPYLTPSQNEVLLFSNMLGTQTFNNALLDNLAAAGAIQTPRDRAAVAASLGSLTIAPGGAASAGVGGTDYSPNRIMTLRYVCADEALCKSVLTAALDVYRVEYSKQKARTVETAKAIYANQLKAAEAQVAAGISTLQAYDAAHPRAQGSSDNADPVRNSLQHNLDQAQQAVDKVKADMAQLEATTQVSNGITGDMAVIDAPRTARGLFGIRGMRSDNLKTDAIVFAVCLIAAVTYLVLVAFLDRTVREPSEITGRFAKLVVTIPDYQQVRRWRWLHRKKAA